MNEVTVQDKYFNPQRIQSMLSVAEKFFAAKAFGRDVQNAEQAFVKIQAGYEMDMAPMEAMNSLYIVNGKVTIWGSAMTKRLRMFGWKISYLNETPGKCTAKIEKEHESYEYTISDEDLLVIKDKQAFKMDRKSKLRYHALSRLIRFQVPEVLGPVQYLAEEIQDYTEGKTIQAEATIQEPVKETESVKEPEFGQAFFASKLRSNRWDKTKLEKMAEVLRTGAIDIKGIKTTIGLELPRRLESLKKVERRIIFLGKKIPVIGYKTISGILTEAILRGEIPLVNDVFEALKVRKWDGQEIDITEKELAILLESIKNYMQGLKGVK